MNFVHNTIRRNSASWLDSAIISYIKLLLSQVIHHPRVQNHLRKHKILHFKMNFITIIICIITAATSVSASTLSRSQQISTPLAIQNFERMVKVLKQQRRTGQHIRRRNSFWKSI
jgi:predicted membrane channel-forming protein YqfA (hemolysin III family)